MIGGGKERIVRRGNRAGIEDRRINLAPALAVAAVGLVGTLFAMLTLYEVAFRQESNRLQALAQSQVRLIEAVARFDAGHWGMGDREKARAATISQIVDAHRSYGGFGETGSFAVGGREGDRIVFVLAHRHPDPEAPKPVPWDSDLAEPMRLALRGESGVIVGTDYRGATVLAAYEPIPLLGLGIVAKIDLDEVRAPFISAGLAVIAVVATLVVFAIVAFQRVTAPLFAEVLRSRQEAVEANKAKSWFIANMSHELRTPLNAIIGFSDMMRQKVFGPLPAAYESYAEDIHRSGRHLLTLVSDILDMAKIEANKYVLFNEIFDLERVIAEAVVTVRWRIEGHGLSLVLDVPPGLPPVNGDRRAIKQVLINLIGNAAKFSPAGGTITVTATAIGRSVTISVADTGIGIAPEDLDRVVKPFVQVEREHGRMHEGTGLGLPLSKALVEMHGGRFTLASVVGQGTTVTITLPGLLAPAPPPVPVGEGGPEVEEAKEQIRWLPSMRVGVAQWDADHRALMEQINRLGGMRQADAGAAAELLATFARCVEVHLASEEAVMRQLSYPLHDAHQASHDDFRVWLSRIRDELNGGATDGLGDVPDVLAQWWYGHIVSVDFGYKEFFEDRKEEVAEALRAYRGVQDDGTA